MKIPTKPEFAICPEFSGRGVCVDVTPLESHETQWGKKDQFQVVFEVDLINPEAEEKQSPRFCVWTQRFTASWHENSAWRRFVFGWLGSMNDQQKEEFDTEALVGQPVQIIIGHEEGEDGKIYARILRVKPDTGADPLKPTGKFTRKKDRDTRSSGKPQKKTSEPPASDHTENRPVAQPTISAPTQPLENNGLTDDGDDPGLVKIHVGSCKDFMLRELPRTKVEKLIVGWLNNDFAKIQNPSEKDKLLAWALREYVKRYLREDMQKAETEKPENPY